MVSLLRTALLGLLFFTTAQAQFQFFEQMFGGGQQHHESSGHGGNVPSDSAWYQNAYNGGVYSISIFCYTRTRSANLYIFQLSVQIICALAL